MDATPSPGVSLFMPTHVRGSEIRQDPIRLKTLLAEAHDALVAAGTDLLDAAAALTLRRGGQVFVLPPDEMPGNAPAAAILRY